MQDEMKNFPYHHVMTLRLNVDSTKSAQIGITPRGYRTIAPIIGGDFDGPGIKGTVLPGGADWVLLPEPGKMLIDVRLTLKTQTGGLIYTQYEGRFNGSADAMAKLAKGEALPSNAYSLVTHVRFETGEKELAWLNDIVAVGIGEQSGFNPIYEIYQIGPQLDF